jgi:hypothetical protein
MPAMSKCANVADTLSTTQNFQTSDAVYANQVAPHPHRCACNGRDQAVEFALTSI